MSTSTENRNESWLSIQDNLILSQSRVYNCIRSHFPITSQQIAEKLDLKINEVVGRVSELSDLFLIEDCGSIEGESGRKRTKWQPIVSSELRAFLINKEIAELDDEYEDWEEIIDLYKKESHATDHIRKIMIKILNKIKRLRTI
jgi:hypothetical protein